MYLLFRNQYLVVPTAMGRSALLDALELNVVSLSIFGRGCRPRLMLFSEKEPKGDFRR
jgi:hypothetical protein